MPGSVRDLCRTAPRILRQVMSAAARTRINRKTTDYSRDIMVVISHLNPNGLAFTTTTTAAALLLAPLAVSRSALVGSLMMVMMEWLDARAL